jgi:Alpha/beta hydrolase domain
VCIPQPFALIGLACALSGSYRPLAPSVIEELYPTHGTYVRKIADKTFERFFERTVLWDGAVQHIRAAAASDVGK